jgi:hypothetical protein
MAIQTCVSALAGTAWARSPPHHQPAACAWTSNRRKLLQQYKKIDAATEASERAVAWLSSFLWLCEGGNRSPRMSSADYRPDSGQS